MTDGVALGYPDSFYSRNMADQKSRPALEEDIDTDVLVIGGGMAGLATALGLAERGHKVVLIEQKRVGWGASGRNGGFVSTGYAAGAGKMIETVGEDQAKALNDLTIAAQALILSRIEKYKIDCGPIVKGKLGTLWGDTLDNAKASVETMDRVFGETRELWSEEQVRDLYKTDWYFGGVFNPDGFHFHSLNFTRGIAAAFESLGGMIYEETEATGLRLTEEPKRVVTRKGDITANHIVFCCSGYIGHLEDRLQAATLPIGTYVMLTNQLEPEVLETAIRAPYAVSDDRFAGDYYRPLSTATGELDGRILWGGRVSMDLDPTNLAAKMLGDLEKVYPQLKGKVKADVAWPGTMGYATHKMPQIGTLSEGVWYCQGFGGHGMCSTTAGGEAIAAAIAGDDERYTLFEPFGLTYAGGMLGPWVAQAIYTWWRLGDWWGTRKARRL